MEPEALVHDYLGRLEAAASALPAERRAELVGDVREHIGLALAGGGEPDEGAVRSVLERLGTPDEIVAAELDVRIALQRPTGLKEAGNRAVPRALSVESRALLALTIGSVVLPFVGPLIGLWLASGSSRWTLVQKRTAALVVLVLLSMPAALLLPALAAGELTWVVTSGGFALPLVPLSGLMAACYLFATTSFEIRVARRP